MVEPRNPCRSPSISIFNLRERRLCRAVNLFAVIIPLVSTSFHVSSISTSTTTQAQAFAFITSSRSITPQLTWGVRRPRLPRATKARSNTITATNRIADFSLPRRPFDENSIRRRRRRQQQDGEGRSVLRSSAGNRVEVGVGQQQEEQKQQPTSEMLLPLLPEGDDVVVDDTPALTYSQQDELDLLAKELGRCAHLRMWERALKALQEAKRKGLPLTASIYAYGITAMSKGGRWREAMQLLDELIADEKNIIKNDEPMLVSYNAAIAACSRALKWWCALDLLYKMESRIGAPPDNYSYGAAMLGLAKCGKPEQALELLDYIRAAGVEPDLVCFTEAMEACVDRGRFDIATKILGQVSESTASVNLSYMTDIRILAIRSCIKDGQWELAEEMFDAIRFASHTRIPPARAYTALIEACARARKGAHARALFKELAVAGGPLNQPDLECYNALIAACAMSGEWETAVKILKLEMPQAGIRPDSKAYELAITGCGRAKRWESALALLNEQRLGEVPSAPADLACYKAALDACGRAGEVRVCMIVMEAMQAEVKAGNKHLKPDKLCYGAALTACRVKGASRTAIGLLNRMEKIDKLKPDQRCLLATVSACLTGGEASTAAVVLEGIVRKGTRTSQGARDGVREMCQPETGGGLNEEGLERCRAALDKLDALEAERVRKAAARKENLEGGGDGRGSGGSGAGGVVVAAAAGVKSGDGR